MLVDLIFVYIIILFVIVSLIAVILLKATVEWLIDDTRDGHLAINLIQNDLLGLTVDIF